MTTHQLARALEAQGDASILALGPDVAVHSATPDVDARAGSLSWISPRVLAAEPERLAAFAGSVLIAPSGAAELEVSGATVCIADSPKLAFTRAVEHALPHLVGDGWDVNGAARHPDADVDPSAVLAPGVVLGAGVRIGPGARIGPNTCIAHTTVEEGASIGANCSIGLAGFGFSRDADGTLIQFPHLGRVRIGARAIVGSNTCIDRGSLGDTVVGAGTCIDNLVHVAHNVRIGEDSLIIALAMLGGSVTVGDRAWVAPSAAVINQRSIGDDAVVGLGAVVLRDVEAGQTVVGNPAKPLRPRDS